MRRHIFDKHFFFMKQAFYNVYIHTFVNPALPDFVTGKEIIILIDWLIGWLIIYCFTSHWRKFHSACEGLLHLDLCQVWWTRMFRMSLFWLIDWLSTALLSLAFKQGGIFIVPHLLGHRVSVFPVSPERTTPFGCLLQHVRGCWGLILTRISRVVIILCLRQFDQHVNNGRVTPKVLHKILLIWKLKYQGC
jgi:hypothetical protein